LPEFLKNYSTLKVFRCDDEGPGTKIIPNIRRSQPSDDIWFFIVDDDIRHLPRTREKYFGKKILKMYPASAYGYADNYLYRKRKPWQSR
jgi:hypothetical protein